MFALLALSAALAAPVPQPAIKIAPIPPADPDAADFDKPPKGALRLLGSRQMRHADGYVGDFAADGRTLFTAGYGTIREWDTDTNTLRRSIPVPDATTLMRVKSTPDAGTLLVWDMKKVQVFDRATKKRLHTLQVPGQRIDHFALSPDGKEVAVGTYEGHVRVFDVNDGTIRELDISHPPLRGDRSPPFIAGVAWSPDGKTLATSARRSGVWGWDANTGRELWTLPAQASDGMIAFTPDSKGLITSFQPDLSVNGYIAGLWDVATQQPKELRGFVTGQGLTVSRDGRYFTNGSQVWDTTADKWVHSFTLPATPESAAFSRDGKRMACGSNGVRLFDVTTGKELFDDTGHSGQVVEISVTPDGKLAATAGHDGTARVWDAGTGKLLYTFRGHLNGCVSVSLSPDGKRLATGNGNEVRVLDLKSGQEVWKASGLGWVTKVAFSPDGDTVAVAGGGLTVHLFDAKTGDPTRKLAGSNNGLSGPWHFVWTPDSTGIVSPVNLMPLPAPGGNPNAAPVPVGGPGGEGDGKFRFVLWDVKSGERVRVIGEPVERYDGPVAVDAEGLHAAVADKQLSLVELKTGKVAWTADADGWGGLAFTGDDRLYAKGVCLDAKTGKKVSELPADLRQTRALAVPPKGNTVLTAVWGDTAVVVWPRK